MITHDDIAIHVPDHRRGTGKNGVEAVTVPPTLVIRTSFASPFWLTMNHLPVSGFVYSVLAQKLSEKYGVRSP